MWGTGFLIKFNKNSKSFYCLMTTSHIISNDMIVCEEKIDVYYDKEKKNKVIILNKNERYLYTEHKLDFSIIEILVKDNIDEDYFLLPNLEYNDLKEKRIYIPQYPNGELAFSEGKIREKQKHVIIYDASSSPVSSGSPIFLDNTTRVIGIHFGGLPHSNENFGACIYPINNLINGDIVKNESN